MSAHRPIEYQFNLEVQVNRVSFVDHVDCSARVFGRTRERARAEFWGNLMTYVRRAAGSELTEQQLEGVRIYHIAVVG